MYNVFVGTIIYIKKVKSLKLLPKYANKTHYAQMNTNNMIITLLLNIE